MDVKEKLTELLRESPYSIYGDRLKSCFSDSCIKRVAEYLIANGVTVVVRCKDCKYGEVDDADIPTQYLCNYHGEREEDK